MTVKIKVDGKTIEAEAGRQLIDVLIENGWDIPHFCNHPGVGPDGYRANWWAYVMDLRRP